MPEDMLLLLECRYRAPECLLTDGYYSYKMDMWSVGCVMYEVMRSAILQTQPSGDCAMNIHYVILTTNSTLYIISCYVKYALGMWYSYAMSCAMCVHDGECFLVPSQSSSTFPRLQ